jgi:hypothetical protein
MLIGQLVFSCAFIDWLIIMPVYQDVIRYCLEVLYPYPAGTAIYILACLCPDETAVLDILRLDLSQTHHHKQLPSENYSLKNRSSLDLFVHLKTYTHIVPTGVYRTFWLELVRSPEHHKQLPSENYSLKNRSSLDLFVHLKTYTIVPTVYRTFWQSWLLTCPIDPGG